MSKSAKDYIATNDFEGAFERYQNATSNRWKNHWFNTCIEIFKSCADWAKKYFLDPVTKILYKRREDIIYRCDPSDDRGNEKCYIIEIYKDDDFLYSKVGTTVMRTSKRMSNIMKEYSHKYGANKIIVNKVYDCGDMCAEGLESYIRAHYIKKNPKTFVSKDRFTIPFDLEEIELLAQNYLN